MKKYKALNRCQIGGYLLWVFGVVLAPFMLIKFSGALVVVFSILSAFILGGEIAAHVLFSKKRELFVPFSFASHGLGSLFVLTGLLIVVINAINGEIGIYGLIMFPTCTVFYALLDFFLIKSNIKILNNTIDKDKFEK